MYVSTDNHIFAKGWVSSNLTPLSPNLNVYTVYVFSSIGQVTFIAYWPNRLQASHLLTKSLERFSYDLEKWFR